MKFPCLKSFTTDLNMQTPLEFTIGECRSLVYVQVAENFPQNYFTPKLSQLNEKIYHVYLQRLGTNAYLLPA